MQYTCCCRLPISHFCEFFFLGSIQLSQFNFRFLNIGRLLASLNSSILQFSWAVGFELFRHRFVPMSTIWMSTSYHYAPVHFSSLFLSLSLLPPIIHLFRSHTVYYPFMCVYTIFFYAFRSNISCEIQWDTHTKRQINNNRKYSCYSDKLPGGSPTICAFQMIWLSFFIYRISHHQQISAMHTQSHTITHAPHRASAMLTWQ